MLIHTIPPVYDKNSKILILGSFPSVKSREDGFFYGHPQNRFWRVMERLFNRPDHELVENDVRTAFLLELLKGGTIEDAMQAGSEFAAKTCMVHGAFGHGISFEE